MKLRSNSFAGLIVVIGIFSVLVITIPSCEQGPGNTDGLRTVCFDSEILPLFQSSCATTDCHDANAEGGFMLDSYEGILAGVLSGDPHSSTIYKTLISTDEDHMPPDTLLAIDDRVLIRVWIEQGAEEILCIEPLDTIPIDTIVPPFPKTMVCFERDILPVMQSSCGITGCHDPLTMREDFDFTTYQGVMDGVVAGNPLLSKIYKSISEEEQSNLMPPLPYNRLEQAQVDSIYNWIASGALDEPCGEGCDTVNIKYTTHLSAIVSNYCTGCHSGTNPKKDVILEGFADLVVAVNNGSVPAVLRATSGYSLMPPSGAMSECDIRKFEIWIENEMPN